MLVAVLQLDLAMPTETMPETKVDTHNFVVPFHSVHFLIDLVIPTSAGPPLRLEVVAGLNELGPELGIVADVGHFVAGMNEFTPHLPVAVFVAYIEAQIALKIVTHFATGRQGRLCRFL